MVSLFAFHDAAALRVCHLDTRLVGMVGFGACRGRTDLGVVQSSGFLTAEVHGHMGRQGHLWRACISEPEEYSDPKAPFEVGDGPGLPQRDRFAVLRLGTLGARSWDDRCRDPFDRDPKDLVRRSDGLAL